MDPEPNQHSHEDEWQGDFDPNTDPEEQRVIHATLDSFQSYRHVAHYNVTHLRRQNFYALPSAHWNLLAEPPFSILDTFNAVDDAIDANADLAEAIFRAGAANFGLNDEEEQTSEPDEGQQSPRAPSWRGKATAADMDKARSTLRQMYRDWSAEGAAERAACYGPVLAALSSEFESTPPSSREGIRVLVPGAGLGRLVLEVCALGFNVEGNEISYHQLMASSFILNHTQRAEQFALHPWALSFSNHASRAHQLQRVRVPDVHPAAALAQSSAGKNVHAFERMGMAAADFCVLYRGEDNRDAFDAVTTVFFIDTAPNLINYIEAIRNCLRPGGVWINLGPLLWHFENDPPGAKNRAAKEGDAAAAADADPAEAAAGGGNGGSGNSSGFGAGLGIAETGSVELTDDEVVALVQRLGFSIERHEAAGSSGETGYISDPRSMLRNVYSPSFWIARKL